jgi:hypothetical protein
LNEINDLAAMPFDRLRACPREGGGRTEVNRSPLLSLYLHDGTL